MTREQLCRDIRTSYCSISIIQQAAELYFLQLQKMLCSNSDPVYCELLIKAFLSYLKQEYRKVLNGTDCFLGLKRISSMLLEYEGVEVTAFCEETAFPEEKDEAFRHFCKLLSSGLHFCETFLQKYES